MTVAISRRLCVWACLVCVQTLILMRACLHVSHQVGTECTKYGTVADVCIFEVITPGYPPEEAVRIFVKFERVEAATRALVDLQGRFFGGRQVGGGEHRGGAEEGCGGGAQLCAAPGVQQGTCQFAVWQGWCAG
jgi:hypothetical protein